MRANPGGQIDPQDVIGRDGLIKGLWRVLEQQSLVLSAERRIGKTCIVKKMIAEPPQGTLCIYRDLEGVHTPMEFAKTLFGDVKRHLGWWKRNMGRGRTLLTRLPGAEINRIAKMPEGIAPHWKTLLVRFVKDMVQCHDGMVILFWDEVPYMLQNIKKRSDEDTAIELLDALRSLRQTHTQLRMVFTGSIGFHHVIDSFGKTGPSGGPLNDMLHKDVPPLELPDAKQLARLLLQGESVLTDNPDESAKEIADTVDCVPFYIHHVVSRMTEQHCDASPGNIRKTVDSFLNDPDDLWQLRHYHDRINNYYAPEQQTFVLNTLDVLCGSQQSLGFDDLFNLLKSHMRTEDRGTARDVLTLLQRDHYIVQERDGAFRFRFPLVQRWWHIHRGLEA